jgi:tRNA-Thr(GGU) m(6)t(6)A37 methyltransferase TsaA
VDITYHPIGVVHSPIRDRKDAPRQPRFGRGIRGTVELDPALEAGLDGLEGFSHVILLCHLHLSEGFELAVVPPGQSGPRGLFATRSPRRPNPIALSVVRLIAVDGCRIEVEDLDLLDGTPVLDVKPYIPGTADEDEVRTGWITPDRKRSRVGMEDA